MSVRKPLNYAKANSYLASIGYKIKQSSKRRYGLKSMSLKQKYGTKSDSSPEVKFIDTSVNVNPNATGTVLLLNACVEGSDYNNRIGRKIELTSVEYSLVFAGGTGDLGTGATYPENIDVGMFSLVYDKQSNGAAPAWSDVYTVSGSVISPFSHRNVNNLDRFVVLATDRLTISVAGPNSAMCNRYIRTKHDVRFNSGNAGTIADINSGGLFLVYADQNTAGTQLTTLYGRVRVRYHDI